MVPICDIIVSLVESGGLFPVLQGPLVLGTSLGPKELTLSEKEDSQVRASAFPLGL